jgi:hypothetical protein
MFPLKKTSNQKSCNDDPYIQNYGNCVCNNVVSDENYDNYEIHVTNTGGPTGPIGATGPHGYVLYDNGISVVRNNILPDDNYNNLNIGSVNKPFNEIHCKELYTSQDSIYIGNKQISAAGDVLRLPVGTLIGGINPGSIKIKNSLPNTAFLQSIQNVSSGDAYIIGNNLYVCDNDQTTPVSFTNVGSITTGPQGPQGPQGQIGVQGPTGPAPINNMFEVNQLTINGANYNKAPMGILNTTRIGPTGESYNNIQQSTSITDSFPTNFNSNEYKIASANFQTYGPTGARNIRSHIQLNIQDQNENVEDGELFIGLYDGSNSLQNFKKTFRNTNGNEYTDTLQFYHYSELDINLSKTYDLFVSCTKPNIKISQSNLNYHAPSSYFTVEDIGL